MSKECTDCGQQLKYDEGSYYCNNKSCGLKGEEVDIECSFETRPDDRQQCYKTGKECKYKCTGLCKESY